MLFLSESRFYYYKEPTSSMHSLIRVIPTTMKFTVTALLAALITTCSAQGVDIGSPANDTSVSPGSNLVVQVDRPVSLYTTSTTKPHLHWFYRTLWRPPLSLVSWLGYSHALKQTQFALLPAKHWEPFSLRGSSTRNSHRPLRPGLLSKISRSLFPRRSWRAPQSFPSFMLHWLG